MFGKRALKNLSNGGFMVIYHGKKVTHQLKQIQVKYPSLSTNYLLDDETYSQNMLEVIHSVILDS